MVRLKIAFPYLLFAGMAALVFWSNVREEAPARAGRLVDPVCHMEVNPSWGFAYTYHGEVYRFCAERCRDRFAADPTEFIGERCIVCREQVDAQSALPVTYLQKTYVTCSAEHRALFQKDPAGFFMHRMWGIPSWLYYASIGMLLLVSFLMFEGKAAFTRRSRGQDAKRREQRPERQEALAGATSVGAAALSSQMAGGPAARDRIDLMRFAPVRFLLRSRPVRFVAQLTMVTFFLLIIAAGLFGNQNPGLNIAPILTWTIWWGGLVVLIMFAGKAWCTVCPWDAIAGWMEKLHLWRKTEEGLGLGLPWPRMLRNVTIATIFFVGLTWVEIGYGVTLSPVTTGYLGLAMLVMAIVSAFLFDRKSFCRYGCLVGRVSGLYAMFSGIEVRSRDRSACRSCHTKECVKGSKTAYGCPTYQYPGTMEINTYCIQCTECLQACPHDNLAVNLRPWGADLAVEGKPRRDEAYLALLMLALTGFHGLTMTPAWQTITHGLEKAGLGHMLSFTTGMAGIMVIPVAIYALLVAISYAVSSGGAAPGPGGKPLTYFDYFVRYAYCVLPIALFYHLAHNLEHLLMEGQKAVSLISDPFGQGWNLFGTAGWTIRPLASLDVLWVMQVILVGAGHVYGLWAAGKITRRIFPDRVSAARGQWPLLIGMIAFSLFSLWLLKQPMEMRTSAM